MSPTLSAPSVPLAHDAHGAIRVGGTRVPLETVVIAFNMGASAEGIVEQYPALQLADVYAVLAYYLQNRAAVDAYVRDQEDQSERAREKNRYNLDHAEIRQRLLNRQQGAT